MVVMGLVVLIMTGFVILYWIEHDGLIFAFNFGRIGFMIWGLSLGLYDFGLSRIYNPSLGINIVGLVVMGNFLLISLVFKIPIQDQIDTNSCSESTGRSGYKLAVLFTLALALISFYVNYKGGGLRYFTHQTSKENFRLGYFLHLATCVAIHFWIKARKSISISKKAGYFILCAVSMFLIMTDMSRSPLILFATGVGIYEVSAYVKKRNQLSRRKIGLLIAALFIIVYVFGVIGDKRASVYFINGILDFYEIKVPMPNAFAWGYMYLTSPMENARYILDANLNIPLSWGNILLYPVIKLFANFLGLGSQYAAFFQSLPRYPAYLWDIYGLNASSFIGAAVNDFDIFGIVIYLLMYDLVAWIWYRLMKSSRITSNSKVILSALLLQIPLFSVFAPSVFGIAFIWVNMFFVIMWNFANRLSLPGVLVIRLPRIRLKQK